ncbi:MAG: hypothetical protein MZU79_04195 [Anaerotruncus sp.]|nr:hypothetical protein [Anaerotruncus sp.]
MSVQGKIHARSPRVQLSPLVARGRRSAWPPRTGPGPADFGLVVGVLPTGPAQRHHRRRRGQGRPGDDRRGQGRPDRASRPSCPTAATSTRTRSRPGSRSGTATASSRA